MNEEYLSLGHRESHIEKSQVDVFIFACAERRVHDNAVDLLEGEVRIRGQEISIYKSVRVRADNSVSWRLSSLTGLQRLRLLSFVNFFLNKFCINFKHFFFLIT